MLNRIKLAQELARVSESLFVDNSQQYECAKKIWHEIVQDPTFIYRIKEVDAPWPVPTWDGKLDEVLSVVPQSKPYQIVSVDGSQVYPDRHQGISCFLINVGSVILHYNGSGHPVQFNSIPFIFSDIDTNIDGESTIEIVNGKRQELELQFGLDFTQQLTQDISSLLLFDGSLIFWHLESKTNNLQNFFLPKYLATLVQLQQKNCINASYISLPKSRELVNLIRLVLCDFDCKKTEKFSLVDKVLDTTIANFFLQPGQRTIVFKNRSSISEKYPDSVRPYFFYLHVGTEIGRVEIPQWIAQNDEVVNFVASCIYDQSQKGNGYPVALAEAHEQAVVKGPDREFFYHMLNKLGFEKHQRLRPSQKVIKKRGIGI